MHEIQEHDSDNPQPEKTPEQPPKELMEPHDQNSIALFRELAKKIRLGKKEGRNDVEAANRLSELIGIDHRQRLHSKKATRTYTRGKRKPTIPNCKNLSRKTDRRKQEKQRQCQ